MVRSAVATLPRGSESVGGDSLEELGGWSDAIGLLVSNTSSSADWGRTGQGRQVSPAGASAAVAVDAERLKRLVPEPSPVRPGPTFHALQEWEGYVVGIAEEEFVARLLDVTAGARYAAEEATIPLEEVSPHDRERMVLGSVFRWVIGYERSPSGTKKRVSQIVFRDLPVVTETDFREGREWAAEIAAKFDL